MYPEFIEILNPEQKQAVTAPEGHLLINAAAGTGKTTTLASRILYLQIEQDIPHDCIFAVSFSRAAKAQLMERLEKLIVSTGHGSQVPTFTFHGLAFRILRIASELGETYLRPGFSMMTSASSASHLFQEHAASLCSGLADDWPLNKRVELYSKAIDLVRQGHAELDAVCIRSNDLPSNRFLTVPSEQSYYVQVPTSEIKKVWQRYEKLLRKFNCIDYPGIITEALLALRHPNGQTRKRVCEGLRYLIIDEYQDTSRAQEQLIFAIAQDEVCLNVVGDDDQTIYSFNGSDVSNILEFTKRVPCGKIQLLPSIHLTENYRSTENILTVANRLLHSIHPQKVKILRPSQGDLSEPLNSYREQNEEIVRVYAPRLDLAAHYVAKEIQHLISEEGIKPSDIAVLFRKDTEHSPQGETVRSILLEMGIEIAEKRDVANRIQYLEVAQNLCQEHYLDELKVVLNDLEAGNLESELEGIPHQQIALLLREAMAYGAHYAGEAFEYFYDLEHEEGVAPPAETGQIQIRSVHSAKGHEFRVVFLMYIGERSFPHGARTDIAEEKRLFYVGVTRAQERLYVIGKPSSQSKTDFFSILDGSGIRDEKYLVLNETNQKQSVVPLSIEQSNAIDIARNGILEEEAKKQNELKKLFEEDDF